MDNNYRLCGTCLYWYPYRSRSNIVLNGLCFARNSLTVSITKSTDYCHLHKYDTPVEMRLVFVENDEEEEE